MHTPKSKSDYTTNGSHQKASGSTFGVVLSLPQKTSRTHKERNVKIFESHTTRDRLNEKWPSTLSDLEACYAQLQEDLKKTKPHTSSSEFQKRQALLELEDGNTQIPVSSAKLKVMTNEPSSDMFSSSDDDRLQQLCKISQERDKAWALELAAVRKHHSLDIAALTSAKLEIQKLKKHLEMVTQSEIRETQTSSTNHEEDVNQLKNKIKQLESQVSELRAALDASEERYRDEYLQSTLQIRDAYERADVAKSESRNREAELVAKLKRANLDIDELRATQKQENENGLAMELKQTRASLLEKETMLQAITEENEKLKIELQKAVAEKNRAVKRDAALSEVRKISESKIVYLTQEADRNSRRVARLMEQLEAAQAANMENGMELRRQKVQCEQWKKAAEAATAMINTESGKYLNRSESLCNSHLTADSHLGSESYSECEEDTPKKKNGSMLKKMGVMWKKSNSMKHT